MPGKVLRMDRAHGKHSMNACHIRQSLPSSLRAKTLNLEVWVNLRPAAGRHSHPDQHLGQPTLGVR